MNTLRKALLLALLVIISGLQLELRADDPNLPVKIPNMTAISSNIRNPVTFEMIHNITGPASDKSGFELDLKDTSLQGMIYSGPYPFESKEADYDYARYRLKSPLVDGKGTVLCQDFFLQPKINANDWPQPVMTVAYRLEMYRSQPGGRMQWLGFYDSFLSFRIVNVQRNDAGEIIEYDLEKAPTVLEGPFVNLLVSDKPGQALICWETDTPCDARLFLRASGQTQSKTAYISAEPARKHEAFFDNLETDREYHYMVELSHEGSQYRQPWYSFRTAPAAGEGEVCFVFASDSREGVGGGEQNYRGCNFEVLSRIGVKAYREGADFILFGGDLVNGYTSETEDFRLQLQGWKQALAGFWRGAAVYPCMGNHETLLNKFSETQSDDWRSVVALDKWPYATDSAEAIFAEQFWNPTNGPEVSDERRPTYKENVFSFQYGPVLCIAFNNNYWYTANAFVQLYGGSPEGYIMKDQMRWIENELERATQDESIKYVVLFAQEPVYPCGGHVKDCMWWNGNNNYRAYTFHDGELLAAEEGMIEVRNRFWRAVSRCPKAAVVLAGDEHEYHRLLVDRTTPVGVMAQDDTDGDGILDKYSPNPEFLYPTWQITAGTAGAPYYAREKTPWEPDLLSSQTGYCVFHADQNRISLTFYTMTGQKLDFIEDLMAVKKQ